MSKHVQLSLALLLAAASSYAAERPTKRQRVVHAHNEQYSPTLQRLVSTAQELDAIPKIAALDYELLCRKRDVLLKRLTDDDFVRYLACRHPGKVLVDDRLSKRQLLTQFLPLPIAINQIIDSYGIQWRKPTGVPRSDNAYLLSECGTFIRYSFRGQNPSGTITLIPSSSRKDSGSEGFLLVVPEKQLTAQFSFHCFLDRKPSQQELDYLQATGHSKEILTLLKNDELFDIPVIESIEQQEDA